MSKYGVISGPYFLVCGLNTETYGVNSVFSPNIGKYGPEITPYFHTFHAGTSFSASLFYTHFFLSFLVYFQHNETIQAAILNFINSGLTWPSIFCEQNRSNKKTSMLLIYRRASLPLWLIWSPNVGHVVKFQATTCFLSMTKN